LRDGKALAHGYHNLQHWNQWLSQQFLGKSLLETEIEHFSRLLKRHFGKHALLLGVPHQYELLNATKIPCHSLVTPLIYKKLQPGCIEGDFHEVPIMTGSMDLVMLPHTLQFVDNPRQLLAEACRIIKPEGLIVISGFNPFSAWGLRKMMNGNKKNMPWGANFIHSQKIKSWLRIADFAMEKHESMLFIPPVNHQGLHKKLHFLENFGRKFFPVAGGAYILVARAKVIPLTPIRLKWKQQLSNIRISGSISGNIARQSK
jgi:SAM-dependent methyltransferase